MTLRILVSAAARPALTEPVRAVLGNRPFELRTFAPGVDGDIAFISRDVTGLSTKHDVKPATREAYDTLLGAASLRWVHVHSAGADRPVYQSLLARGVAVTTSSGANAAVVAQTAVAGLLALTRRLPQLLDAQRERRWAPLIGGRPPADLMNQTAVVVGWGPIGQHLGAVLSVLGLSVVVARTSATPAGPGLRTVSYEQLGDVLPEADWLILACPLTDRTRHLIDAAALARLRPTARLINVSRGEVVDEPAMIAALRDGRLGGAFLDVFLNEPLPADSPLWTLPEVIVTPHSAGVSDGNAARTQAMFLDNLGRWLRDQPMVNRVAFDRAP